MTMLLLEVMLAEIFKIPFTFAVFPTVIGPVAVVAPIAPEIFNVPAATVVAPV